MELQIIQNKILNDLPQGYANLSFGRTFNMKAKILNSAIKHSILKIYI